MVGFSLHPEKAVNEVLNFEVESSELTLKEYQEGRKSLYTCAYIGVDEFDKLVKDIPETQQVVWVHDEIQVECLDKDAETVGRLAVKAIECTGKHFQLRLPLTGEYKIGNNWSETH